MENVAKLQNLVEISKLVTESTDFYKIKDKIVNKMLEVINPTKACVNLFYNESYSNAYLVCSNTLDYIPTLFKDKSEKGIKIDFKAYPKYIHEAVDEKKHILIENVFADKRAEGEELLAKEEKYIGRAVFPLIIKGKTVGFMTCFLSDGEHLNHSDIDFIQQVASMLSLSIEITNKNNTIKNLVIKLRKSISRINDSIKKLYQSKDIEKYLNELTKMIMDITASNETATIIYDKKNKKMNKFVFTKNNSKQSFMDKYKGMSVEDVNKYAKESFLEQIIEVLMDFENENGYNNAANGTLFKYNDIKTVLFQKMYVDDDIVVLVLCANAKKYSFDDVSTVSILVKQILVGIQLFEYNAKEIKSKILDKELSILDKQQKLIMNENNIKIGNSAKMMYFHKPARVVGGDFYQVIEKEDKVVFIFSDVMGHGIISNNIVATIKGAFLILSSVYSSASKILTELNKQLYNEFDKMELFATGLVGVVDRNEKRLTIANAGHYDPIIIDTDNKFITFGKYNKGIPIGIMKESIYDEVSVDINNYKTICLYTDGIIELENENREEFGIERLKNFLLENGSLPEEDFLTSLSQQIVNFSHEKELKDDILLACVTK